MAKVTATPSGPGGRPLTDHSITMEGPDEPPEDAIIGECVGEAVRSAWRSGYDPTKTPVIVTFS